MKPGIELLFALVLIVALVASCVVQAAPVVERDWLPQPNAGITLPPMAEPPASPSSPGMVDISGWTTIDGGAVVFEATDYRVRWTTLSSDEDSGYYGNYTATPFDGDFAHHFTFGWDTASAGTIYMNPWMLTNDIDDGYNLAIGEKAFTSVLLKYDGSDLSIKIQYREAGVGGATAGSAWEVIDSDYYYRALYATIGRDDDGGADNLGQIVLNIYRTPSRTTALYTHSIDVPAAGSQDDYNFLWLCNSYDNNDASTQNGFSGSLYLDETPITMFDVSNAFTPSAKSDGDSFEDGAYTGDGSYGNESWTAAAAGSGGSPTCATSTDWVSVGTYSVKIYADAANDHDYRLYFTPGDTTYEGGTVKLTANITVLESGKVRQVVYLQDVVNTEAIVVQAVEDGAGTINWQMGVYESAAWTWTAVSLETVSLNTEYDIVLAWNDGTTVGSLYVDGDVVLVTAADAALAGAVNRVGLGYFGGQTGNRGGTMYVDDIQWHSGTAYAKSLSRGGTGDDTIVLSWVRSEAHSGAFGNERRYDYSIDDGETWTNFYILAANNTRDYKYDSVRAFDANTWYFFTSFMNQADETVRVTEVFKCDSFDPTADTPDTTESVTEVYDSIDDDSKNFRIFASRILSGNDYTVGIVYSDSDDLAGTQVAKSALYSVANDTIYNEETIVSYGDDATYEIVDEPMIWADSDGDIACTIRHIKDPTDWQERVKYYEYDGGWGAGQSTGTDWNQRNATMRAFSFGNYNYWMGRDQEGLSFPDIIHWASFVLQTERDTPMDFIEEMWWGGASETGNGDVDAKIAGGSLYLDYTNNMGIGWYYRLYIGTAATGTTVAATAVLATGATLNGSIDTISDAGNCVDWAFVWGTTSQGAPDGAGAGSYDSVNENGAGSYGVDSYSYVITAGNLLPNTTYYFRFGWEDPIGWIWESELSLTTLSGLKPAPGMGPDFVF